MFRRMIQALFALATILVSTSAAAVSVTLTDSCGGTLNGSNASASADQTGNLTITGTTSPSYVPLFGCDPNPPSRPSCSLSASQTLVSAGVSTTLFAKCSSTPTSWAWVSPPDSPIQPPNAASFSVSFPSAGAYTYSVAASNGAGQGPVSNQLTILVSDSTAKPFCTLTASPVVVAQGGFSTLQVSCNPAPQVGGYSWAPAESGALNLAAGSSGGSLKFANAGVFTYKVQGTNTLGPGPTASASVTVIANLVNPTITKAFSPASIGANAASTLTVTLGNGNSFALTGAAFTDSYPAGVVNAAVPSPATTCTGGSVTGAAGSNSLSLAGATVPASGSCTVTVAITSASVGSYSNSIPAGALVTSNGGNNPSPATASLTVTSPIVFANAGFESPVTSSDTPITTQNQSGWTSITGTVSATSSSELTAIPRPTSGSPQFATFNSGLGGGKIGQYLTVPNGTYTVSVRAQGYTGSEKLIVLVNSSAIYTSPAISTTGWVTYTTPAFPISGSNFVLFEFSMGGSGYLWIDDVTINPN